MLLNIQNLARYYLPHLNLQKRGKPDFGVLLVQLLMMVHIAMGLVEPVLWSLTKSF